MTAYGLWMAATMPGIRASIAECKLAGSKGSTTCRVVKASISAW
jgi:hypothetical protein